MSGDHEGLVHVRTPAYRRPEALARCLASLQAQTWESWICDVYDDDPDGSAEAVCRNAADRRIRYIPNRPQRFASANIDQCFTSSNPHGASFFCVVEDDNYLLPTFMAANIALLRAHDVEIVLRNQFVEHGSGTPAAALSVGGVLDGQLTERTYEPELFRLSLLAGIGVSNGGLFWSRHARTDLEIGLPCSATIQEYLRTFLIHEPVHVAMEPLAVWAENGGQTMRNLGDGASYLRRELDLKRQIQSLQRRAWRLAGPALRAQYLESRAFSAGRAQRAAALTKALLVNPADAGPLPAAQRLNLVARGVLILLLGRLPAAFRDFVATRPVSLS